MLNFVKLNVHAKIFSVNTKRREIGCTNSTLAEGKNGMRKQKSTKTKECEERRRKKHGNKSRTNRAE